jgi:hypothetical protein
MLPMPTMPFFTDELVAITLPIALSAILVAFSQLSSIVGCRVRCLGGDGVFLDCFYIFGFHPFYYIGNLLKREDGSHYCLNLSYKQGDKS